MQTAEGIWWEVRDDLPQPIELSRRFKSHLIGKTAFHGSTIFLLLNSRVEVVVPPLDCPLWCAVTACMCAFQSGLLTMIIVVYVY